MVGGPSYLWMKIAETYMAACLLGEDVLRPFTMPLRRDMYSWDRRATGSLSDVHSRHHPQQAPPAAAANIPRPLRAPVEG